MAFAQALVTVIVLIIWLPQITSWAPAVVQMFGLNASFAMLFVGSALLFQKAARGEPAPGESLPPVAVERQQRGTRKQSRRVALPSSGDQPVVRAIRNPLLRERYALWRAGPSR